MPAATRWEHKLVFASGKEHFEEKSNELGRQGYELVHFTKDDDKVGRTTFWMAFKRPRDQESP